MLGTFEWPPAPAIPLEIQQIVYVPGNLIGNIAGQLHSCPTQSARAAQVRRVRGHSIADNDADGRLAAIHLRPTRRASVSATVNGDGRIETGERTVTFAASKK